MHQMIKVLILRRLKKESLYAAGGAYYALLEMHLKVRDQRPSLVTPDAIHAIWDT